MSTGMRAMRILITGHTRGLGLALFEHYRCTGHSVYGVSRADDCDISTPEGRDKIVTLSMAYEVFINNAWDGYSQCDLLLEVYRMWKETGRTGVIVNIGSRAGVDHAAESETYHKSKSALLKLSDELAKLKHPGLCVSCINFGLLRDTDEETVAIPIFRATNIVARVITDAMDHGIQHRHMTVEALPH